LSNSRKPFFRAFSLPHLLPLFFFSNQFHSHFPTHWDWFKQFPQRQLRGLFESKMIGDDTPISYQLIQPLDKLNSILNYRLAFLKKSQPSNIEIPTTIPAGLCQMEFDRCGLKKSASVDHFALNCS
jgi:hypothetical protein